MRGVRMKVMKKVAKGLPQITIGHLGEEVG